MYSRVQTLGGFHSTLADIHARAANRPWFVKVWISCAEGADILLLDNICRCRITETGVDYVSTGALTKDVKAMDLAMRFTYDETWRGETEVEEPPWVGRGAGRRSRQPFSAVKSLWRFSAAGRTGANGISCRATRRCKG